MHRSVRWLFPLVLLAGCSLPGIELGGHPVKAGGLCESQGGWCSCDGNASVGPTTSPYPVLDCPVNPLSCPVVCYGVSLADAGVPDAGPSEPRLPRLVVGSSEGALAIWNKVNGITGDGAPSETIAIPMGLTTVTAAPGLLTVGFENGEVAIFDYPRGLGPTSTPRATVQVSPNGVRGVVASFGDLYILSESGAVAHVKGVATATSASTAKILAGVEPLDDLLAVSEWETITGPARESGELWQIYAGPSVYDPQPTWLSGNTKIRKGAAHRVALAGSTLFSADDKASEVQLIGRFVTVLASGPGVFQTLNSGLSRVSRLAVQRDVAIVAGIDGSGRGAVALYVEAAAVTVRTTPPNQPDKVITHASLGTPIDVALGTDGRLYVLDADGISIFRDVKNKPTFVTEIRTGIDHPRTLNLIE